MLAQTATILKNQGFQKIGNLEKDFQNPNIKKTARQVKLANIEIEEIKVKKDYDLENHYLHIDDFHLISVPGSDQLTIDTDGSLPAYSALAPVRTVKAQINNAAGVREVEISQHSNDVILNEEKLAKQTTIKFKSQLPDWKLANVKVKLQSSLPNNQQFIELPTSRQSTNGQGFSGILQIGSKEVSVRPFNNLQERIQEILGDKVSVEINKDEQDIWKTQKHKFAITIEQREFGVQPFLSKLQLGLIGKDGKTGEDIEIDDQRENERIWIPRIPGNWLRTAVNKPQVRVQVGSAGALCQDDDACNFEFIDSTEMKIESVDVDVENGVITIFGKNVEKANFVYLEDVELAGVRTLRSGQLTAKLPDRKSVV